MYMYSTMRSTSENLQLFKNPRDHDESLSIKFPFLYYSQSIIVYQ